MTRLLNFWKAQTTQKAAVLAQKRSGITLWAGDANRCSALRSQASMPMPMVAMECHGPPMNIKTRNLAARRAKGRESSNTTFHSTPSK
eukprot:5266720-Amphidinium_carterae.1